MSDRDEAPGARREPHRPYSAAESARRRHEWLRPTSEDREDNRTSTGRRVDHLKWWN